MDAVYGQPYNPRFLFWRTAMRQPNLTDVALFAAVVEAGGFRVAAQ